MGLLSHISNSSSSTKTVTKTERPAGTGLLARAQQSTTKTFSSFQDWARSKGYDHCGILSPVHGMMVITHAYGIDSQTVANSVSSKDFWNGTLSQSKPIINYSKSDNDFYNFLQFFSFDLKNSISHISFVKLSSIDDQSLLMIFNNDSDKEINIKQSDIENLALTNQNINTDYNKYKSEISIAAKNNKYSLYTLSFEDLIENSIKTIQLPEENIKHKIIECVKEEIFDLLSKAFSAPSFVSVKNSSTLKIAYLNESNIDEMLLQSHIGLVLSETLCSPEKMPVLASGGTSFDTDYIINFLEK